jgi:hypothetical protein
VLFIDANEYLDIYRLPDGPKLLKSLKAQRDHIFVTTQIVDEVRRNKVTAAADFLERELKKIEIKCPGCLPLHFGKNAIKALGEKIKALNQNAKQIKEELERLAIELLERISRSEDEVSKEMERLFANAVDATEDEMKRARARRETGRAPGKGNQSLGDQINWEQFLGRCKRKRQVWVISRDGDYVSEYGGKAFLNASLHHEILSLGTIEAFPFTKLEEGIRHFVETTGGNAEKLLKPEEAEVINQEQARLPPLSMSGTDAATRIALQNRLMHSDNALIAAILGVQQPFASRPVPNALLQALKSPVIPVAEHDSIIHALTDQAVQNAVKQGNQPKDAGQE